MENLIREYFIHFGDYPQTIGLFWQDISKAEVHIIKAIETNTPYNEYELLSKEEQKAFDDGELLF